MEFRAHFFIENIISLIWAIVVMLLYFFIFKQVNTISGWTLNQMLLLTAVYFLVDRIFDSLFEINFDNFVELVNSGELDLVLTKPLSAQFFVSLRRFSLAMVFSNLSMIGVIIYLCRRWFLPSFSQIGLFLILLVCSVVITYSLWFITLLPVFWWGRVENLQHLFRPLHQVCRVPIDVTGKLKLMFTFVLPLAFVATIPAQSLFSRLNFWLVLYAVFAAIFLLWLSGRLWRFCLKFYTSASS
jgi:ABC-2 type transport system permease protein